MPHTAISLHLVCSIDPYGLLLLLLVMIAFMNQLFPIVTVSDALALAVDITGNATLT